MASPQRAMRSVLFALVMLFVALLLPTPISAMAPQPTYAIANVDGNTGEWNLATDYFADMYVAANPDREVESKLYLHYHCNTGTLYALVLPEPGFSIVASGGDAFIKLGNNNTLVNDDMGDNNVTPDFHYFGVSGNTATGWEASAFLAPGTYTNLNVHTNVFDSSGQMQTSAVANRAIAITIECPPLAVVLASFEATARPADILVTWETASESDNLGFNLYRSDSANGERTRLNGEMIPSQAPGGGGAAYEWADGTVSTPATYYYWVETVDIAGGTAIYGPVSADFPSSPTAVTVSTFSAMPTATPYALFAITGLALVGALVVLRFGKGSKTI